MNGGTIFRRLSPTGSFLLLGVLMGCIGGGSSSGGGNPPPQPTLASGLDYINPTSGTYQLVKNASLSTPTHLVLDVVGSQGTMGRGLAFTLSTDLNKVVWSNVAPTDPPGTYLQNGTAFNLGTGAPILKARLQGQDLQAVVAQKGTAGPPAALNQPLARVAMDFKTGQTTWSGTPILLLAPSTASQVLPGSTGAPQTMSISVGVLSAK